MKIGYTKLEKLVFALVITVRKLCPYFQAHTVVLLMDQAIKAILHRLDTSGWIAKWTLNLSDLDIYYQLRPSVKVQILADFVLECTIPDEQNPKETIGKKSKDPESLKGDKSSKTNLEVT